MADLGTPSQSGTMNSSSPAPTPKGATPQKRGPSLHEIYALPAPIRTFPLPSFYPANPLSVLYVACAWLKQVVSPPPAEPATIHKGLWSEATNSVHVLDESSMRALWEQGFYGKGSLSRSEPNWLKRELVRQGLEEGFVSEINTLQRRNERIQAKWERARLEQEAIRQTRLEEAEKAEKRRLAQSGGQQASASTLLPLAAPVGPTELLALPNAMSELSLGLPLETQVNGGPHINGELPEEPPVTDDPVMASLSNLMLHLDLNGTAKDTNLGNAGTLVENGESPVAPSTPRAKPGLKTLKSQKSVRFSPKVESTTFELFDPPSPNYSSVGDKSPPSEANGAKANGASGDAVTSPVLPKAGGILNKEHLQLMPEEALWLSFGLGALVVSDPATGKQFSPRELLTLFRQHYNFPPRTGPDDPDLEPDDGFLLHYAVYHHFRSLGWVPRAGIKFGVDWLLYAKGPVFDHAEFGLVVIPSYSDPWWKKAGKRSPQKTWHWLHSVIRVLSHVTKSLVLVYVDVPPPPTFDRCLETGFAEALKLYNVREVMVKRWSSNRNR
jgi:tRNA-splicing endonuclease subunit Sen2